MALLRRNFYSRPPEEVARDLIGKVLVRKLLSGRRLEGVIVEAEAYGGLDDPASHAFKGKTKRNEAMFGPPGHAYVYFTYGFHHCLNFVTGSVGEPSAALIRAVEPVRGIRWMLERRKTDDTTNIASGPGKLCRAFSIDLSLDKCDVTVRGAPIQVVERIGENYRVSVGRRVGVAHAKEKMWRFCALDSRFISKAVTLKA